MLTFTLKHPSVTQETLGFLPLFLSENDLRTAQEQIDKNYAHGGGWSPFKGFTMTPNALLYPGDPPMQLLAEARLHNQIIRFYQSSWLAVIEPDGSYEISRCD